LSSIPSLNTFLNKGRSRLGPLELLIEQSGVKLTVGTLFGAAALSALLAGAIAQRFGGMILVSLIAAILASLIPLSVLKAVRTRRLLKLEEQFPEALALMSRALKAGHTFTTGLAMVAEEMPKPLGQEFRTLYEHQNFGMAIPDALRAFAERVSLLDAKFFVTAVLIQRESGGNLSEILDNIGTVMRDRFRVKRQIRVISAHARMTGWVLVGVPPGLALAVFMLNPGHLRLLTEDPLGIQMIVAACIMQTIGTVIIRQLVKIEY
jgi:tight adherence protein B